MVGHGGSSAGSYLADRTSPIPSHCASIAMTSTVRVNILCSVLFCYLRWLGPSHSISQHVILYSLGISCASDIMFVVFWDAAMHICICLSVCLYVCLEPSEHDKGQVIVGHQTFHRCYAKEHKMFLFIKVRGQGEGHCVFVQKFIQEDIHFASPGFYFYQC